MCMNNRWISGNIQKALRKPFVHILFGARQTGKTTLLRSLIPNPALAMNLADPEERTRLMADPGLFRRECEALPVTSESSVVWVDEAQAVPSVFDAVQVMFDANPGRWRFVLSGSSARKLRKTGANLLPGRAILHRLYPLVTVERPAPDSDESMVLPLPSESSGRFPPSGLEERLAYGELPGIAMMEEEDRSAVLRSYTTLHLEEELRRESLVKDWGAFVNFLRLAAAESGKMVNLAAISREAGVSLPTVKSYYQLLEDMFMGFSIPAYSGSPRKHLLSTHRFCFFDLGIRHAAAGLTPGPDIVHADPGVFFEQWVGIELWKRLQYLGEGTLSYFRTKDGSEVDYVIARHDEIIPIEVKWTARPSPIDARHLARFVAETPKARRGFVVCRCPRPQQLCEGITAIPWQRL